MKNLVSLIIMGAIVTTLPIQARANELYGMFQMYRSDGFFMYYLIGTFDDRPTCQSQVMSIVDSFIAGAEGSGHTAETRYAVCDERIPEGSSYQDLRKGTNNSHYILFTPTMRVMFAHERGTQEYERQICEYMRGELFQARGLLAECIAPGT